VRNIFDFKRALKIPFSTAVNSLSKIFHFLGQFFETDLSIFQVNSLSMIRVFYVDPSSVPQATIAEQGHDEKRWPLWRRDMPG
jgi:hypothetical protein